MIKDSAVVQLDSVSSKLFIPDFWVTAPEYGTYIKRDDNFDNGLILTEQQVKVLLNRDRSDPRTLLNPDNMRDFLDYFGNGKYNLIIERFKLSSDAQVVAFYNYIEYSVWNFLKQKSDYNNIAMGSLM